jgi:hypothetical protein
MTCDKCGAIVQIGQFPFCPHEVAHVAAHGDDIPGGQVIETICHEPLTFYSKKAIVAAADAHGLRPTDRFPSWRGVIDAKTLDNARVLLSRGSKTVDEMRCETASFTVREIARCS